MSHVKRWPRLAIVGLLVLAAFGASEPAAQAQGSLFTVTTTSDLAGTCPSGPNGPCSLRQAIRSARDAGSGSIVNFALLPNDPNFLNNVWTINLTSGTAGRLFIEGNGITIDGTSQTDIVDSNAEGPEVIIDGTNISGDSGIVVIGNENKIYGLGLINFGRASASQVAGIKIDGDRNEIKGCYIGIDRIGENAAGNNGAGILISATGEENIIGGDNTNDDEANVISGNLAAGINIDGGDRNRIRGNFVGTDKGAADAVPNLGNGIFIDFGANDNIVGPSPDVLDPKLRNVVAGNGAYGIVVKNSSGNKLYGNRVGLDKNTTGRIPNVRGGIQIDGTGLSTTNNIIGGVSAANELRNFIAGNTGEGIYITGENASNNTIQNNYIGLNLSGLVPGGAAKSHSVGVLVDLGANNNTIGGLAAGNVISGNGGDGVRIVGDPAPNVLARTDDNTIVGNYIGTNITATGPISNTGNGILIGTNAFATFVGGASVGERNVINYNGLNGIHLNSANIEDTTIQRNLVAVNGANGVRIDGSAFTTIMAADIVYNTLNGVQLTGTDSTLLAGEDPTLPARISGNGEDGIKLTNTTTTTIQYINTTPEPNAPSNRGDGVDAFNDVLTNMLLNTFDRNDGLGVRLDGSFDLQLAGEEFAARGSVNRNLLGGVSMNNVLSATLSYVNINENGLNSSNTPVGIADGITMGGNTTQVALYGSSVNDNTGVGVKAAASDFLRIEGISDTQPGSIQRNRQDGVQFSGVTSTTVQFNTIFNNYGDGLRAQAGTDDVVVTRNRIRFNGPQNAQGGVCPAFAPGTTDPRTVAGQGVSIRDNGTRRVRVLRNSFTRNCGLGIIRITNGSNPAEPNDGIQPPVSLGLSVLTPTTGSVRGQILLTGNGSCEGCTVELYEADPAAAPDGEGFRKLNTPEQFITTFDEQGRFGLILDRLPQQLMASATDKDGNSSEFVVFSSIRSVTIDPPRASFAYPTQVITYFHTVNNTGNVDDTFQLTYDSEYNWGVALNPPGNFQVLAGTAFPVTVTLTLPAGPAAEVAAGLVEHTRISVTSVTSPTVTDSVTDTTTVLPKVVISVTPLTSLAETQATKLVTHTHQIRNIGNITATLNLAYTPNLGWPTTLSANTLTLVSGQAVGISLGVTPPNGTTAGASERTIINISVPADASQNKVVTDTTTVVVSPKASLVPNNSGDGVADRVTTYLHTVTNLSNGTARFRLNAVSSLGSTITFASTTGGVTLDGQNSFTLGVTAGQNPPNIMNFEARVRLPRNAALGAVDIVTVQLIDVSTGAIIASVQDRTTIRRGSLTAYLPIIRK